MIRGTHLVDQILHPALTTDNTLHVIGVVSNPAMFNSRYRLARQWEIVMSRAQNVKLYMVEAAYGDRAFEVTDSSNPQHLQLRTNSEIWIKEAMINLGERMLPLNWKYMAWVDCDVFFQSPSWALDTIHALQHSPIVQPWQNCTDMDPNGSIMETHVSFGSLTARGIPRKKSPTDPYAFAHTGYAWACTKWFWENTRGLLDFAILGSADHQMATALVNEIETSYNGNLTAGFKQGCLDWQYNAFRACQGNVGYIPGTISHSFHGTKKNRGYSTRWKILLDNGFSPKEDIVYDAQGLIQLNGKPQLEQDIRAYNRSRNEDSIDT
jgi:hypothetical protein